MCLLCRRLTVHGKTGCPPRLQLIWKSHTGVDLDGGAGLG